MKMNRGQRYSGEDNAGIDVEEDKVGVPSPEENDFRVRVGKPGRQASRDAEAQEEEGGNLAKKETSIFDYFRPNRKLLLIKMHFFSGLMGSAPIWMFLSLIIRQRGISPEGIGLLWTMLFVVGVASGSLLITLIDFFKIHRSSFIISTVVTPIALSMIYWTPHVSTNHRYGHINSTEAKIYANNTFGYSLLSDNYNCSPSSIEYEVNLQDSLIETELLSNSSIVPLPVHNDKSDHKFRFNDSDCNLLKEKSLHDKELLVSELVKQPRFWAIMTFILVASLASLVSNNITDSTCFLLLGKDSHQYGQQRLFGAAAWGLCALLTGALVDAYSTNLPEKDYFPAFMMVAVCAFVDVVVVTKIEVPTAEKGEGFSIKSLLHVIVTPNSFLFFLTVFVGSTSHYILSTFHLLLVEEVADSWDSNFPFLKTLQGLIIAVRCFLGEIPLFIISGDIILMIGVKGSLTLVLVCHALRYILYFTITNPWFFLPVELLHGVNYGLFKSAASYYTNKIAPQGTTASMLAVLKVFSLAGKPVSGMVGGVLWSWFGGHGTFLATGIFLAVYLVIYTCVNLLLARFRRSK